MPSNEKGLPQPQSGTPSTDNISKHLDLFEFNGERISDEPRWMKRISEISKYLPNNVVAGISARLDAEALSHTQRIESFAKLYKLTPSETKLLISLAQGRSVPDHASLNAISVNTGRAHMQNVLDKTGASGQLDLMRMLNAPG